MGEGCVCLPAFGVWSARHPKVNHTEVSGLWKSQKKSFALYREFRFVKAFPRLNKSHLDFVRSNAQSEGYGVDACRRRLSGQIEIKKCQKHLMVLNYHGISDRVEDCSREVAQSLSFRCRHGSGRTSRIRRDQGNYTQCSASRKLDPCVNSFRMLYMVGKEN